MSSKKAKSKGKDIEAYGNTWYGANPALQKNIAAIEKHLKMTLPEDLITLLQLCAGGRPSKDYYICDDYDVEVNVGYILPASKDSKRGDIMKEYDQLHITFEFPVGLIPFALDNGHANYFCLETKTGEVIYWLHDDPEDRVRKVSNSLEEFLAGLTDSPY